MHYYQFNIGDYASHTAHLDPIEDIAYRRMLDWCYTHETSLPQDVESISRLIRMREYAPAIRDVLNEFFERTEDGWFSSRVQREIDHYKAKIEQASKAGKASAERRLNGRSTGVQPTNNQEPITKNHKPRTKNHIKGEIVTRPESVDEQLWNDWLLIRKKKNAPLTQSAWELMIKESEKASLPIEKAIEECCLRNWQSFKADWVKQDGGKTMSKQQALEARNDEVARQWLASKRNQT